MVVASRNITEHFFQTLWDIHHIQTFLSVRSLQIDYSSLWNKEFSTISNIYVKIFSSKLRITSFKDMNKIISTYYSMLLILLGADHAK